MTYIVDTRYNVLKLVCFVPLSLSGLNIFYVLRQSL